MAVGNPITARASILIAQEIILPEAARPAPEIASLTTRMAASDEAAFRQFYDLYFNRLLRYLLAVTRNEETAREALQLTLLRVARYAKRFDSEEKFWSWLTVLARSSVVDEQRKTKRRSFFLTRFFQRAQVENESHESETELRLAELLETNLSTLADDERELIQRKYFDRESVKEIAMALNSTEKAVESRLVRARRKLKDSILTQLKNEN